ncbi:hypothetical protein IGK38_002185 [Enterococcus pernyi]|uniref:DUF3173 domain-containing protein n=1 Tax=Enterococcus mundtii TaxID=53346 RepID=A0ABQ0VEA6_ENTMU|nr:MULTISPECIES: DUF3173 family protein [Enterococcus]GEN19132.1 hypothetical protein LAC02_24130 [Ligilactobacillus acidipiscis]AUB53352.1 hypothetical protein EM4838_10205 [Enterococcus mundtii]ELS0445245.1 DUF3173 family protein [Enterococcus faecium]NTQ95186.1 DUF3173 family protein [Enterococcus faecium]OJG56622.1 hypothetical protein RV08_GL002519 [Enterococcus mundtii]
MEKVEKTYDVMIDRNRLIELGFKPSQASKMIRDSKEYLANVEGISFYSGRQIAVVPAKIIQKLFYIEIR